MSRAMEKYVAKRIAVYVDEMAMDQLQRRRQICANEGFGGGDLRSGSVAIVKEGCGSSESKPL